MLPGTGELKAQEDSQLAWLLDVCTKPLTESRVPLRETCPCFCAGSDLYEEANGAEMRTSPSCGVWQLRAELFILRMDRVVPWEKSEVSTLPAATKSRYFITPRGSFSHCRQRVQTDPFFRSQTF